MSEHKDKNSLYTMFPLYNYANWLFPGAVFCVLLKKLNIDLSGFLKILSVENSVTDVSYTGIVADIGCIFFNIIFCIFVGVVLTRFGSLLYECCRILKIAFCEIVNTGGICDILSSDKKNNQKILRIIKSVLGKNKSNRKKAYRNLVAVSEDEQNVTILWVVSTYFRTMVGMMLILLLCCLFSSVRYNKTVYATLIVGIFLFIYARYRQEQFLKQRIEMTIGGKDEQRLRGGE